MIILTLIYFGDAIRTDAMEERNVCNTNFEKSCELVEVTTIYHLLFIIIKKML